MHDKIGKVVLAVFDGCVKRGPLNVASAMKRMIVMACEEAGANVMASKAVQFFNEEEPGLKDGASAVAVLAESHAAAHSWPRRKKGAGQYAVMVHTCGDIDPLAIALSIGKAVGQTRHKIRVIDFDELIFNPSVPWISGDG